MMRFSERILVVKWRMSVLPFTEGFEICGTFICSHDHTVWGAACEEIKVQTVHQGQHWRTVWSELKLQADWQLKLWLTHRLGVHIQGVSRLQGITAGGDFLGLCDQKSSHKRVSDLERLRSYDRFLIPIHALVWTASISWRVAVFSPLQTGHSRELDTCVVPKACGERRAPTCYLRGWQPSGSLCCGRRWHFQKSALSTDKFKLKAI
jgi:hypothetical protein